MPTFNQPATQPSAGLLRRVGAIFYDGLLLLGTLFIATALVLLLTGGAAVPSANQWFPIYLLSICFLFYGWFWTHGGQTLGMRAWKIRLQQPGGEPVTWRQALLRFVLSSLWAPLAILPWSIPALDSRMKPAISLAMGGGFFLFTLLTRWHDRYSNTRLVLHKQVSGPDAAHKPPR